MSACEHVRVRKVLAGYSEWLTRRRNRLVVAVLWLLVLLLVAVFYLHIGAAAWLVGPAWAAILAWWVFDPRFGSTRW